MWNLKELFQIQNNSQQPPGWFQPQNIFFKTEMGLSYVQTYRERWEFLILNTNTCYLILNYFQYRTLYAYKVYVYVFLYMLFKLKKKWSLHKDS